MIWVLTPPLALALWWLFDIRRALHLRLTPSPRVERSNTGTITPPESFAGAVTTRYVVVRWPREQVHYAGNHPTLAKQTYEAEAPIPGEAVEFWDGRTCRAHKEM